MSIIKIEVYDVKCDLNFSKRCQYGTAYDSESITAVRGYAQAVGWIFDKETKQDICPACQDAK